MSEPLTNVEIQDVLSSIRRLVSEENRVRSVRREPRDRGGDRAGEAPPPAPERQAPPQALILTEALRVPAPEEGGAAAPSRARQEGESGAETPPAPKDDIMAGLESTIEELEAAVAGIPESFEPDGSEGMSEIAGARQELQDAFADGFEVDVGDDPAGPARRSGTQEPPAARATPLATEGDRAALSPDAAETAAATTDGEGEVALESSNHRPAATEADAAPSRERETATAEDEPVEDGPAAQAAAPEDAADADPNPLGQESEQEDGQAAGDHVQDGPQAPIFNHAGRHRPAERDEADRAAAPPPSLRGRLTLTPSHLDIVDALSDDPWDRGDAAMPAEAETVTEAEAEARAPEPEDLPAEPPLAKRGEPQAGAAEEQTDRATRQAAALSAAPPSLTEPAEAETAKAASSAADPGFARSASPDPEPAEAGPPRSAPPAAMPAIGAPPAAEADRIAEGIVDHIDEDLLSEIVADAIRRELQGPLGERITRNVRMLVRREINRVLASHGIGTGQD